jgi:hypothetical protein
LLLLPGSPAPPLDQPWCSSKWPWSLIGLLGFLWCYFESCSWCSWDEVRRDGGACGECGCLWWCLSSLSAKFSFALLTFWSKPQLCPWLSWMVNYFGTATCNSGCPNNTNFAKWILVTS